MKHRFYILDDARCPIPDKSYKDLAPKQIEAIHNHYTSIKNKIDNQEKDLITAKEELETNRTNLKKLVEEIIGEANRGKYNFNAAFKGLTVDGAYNKLMSGELEVINKTPRDCLNTITASQKIIDIGIRTPEQIVESFMDKPFVPKKVFSC